MTYTEEAKNLFEAFHDAMGNWERPAFERLTTREIQAWQIATGHTSDLEQRVEDAYQVERDLRYDLELSREETAEAEEDLSRALRDRDKAEKQAETIAIECGRLIGLLMEVSR